MSYVSILVPFVLAYIFYAWRALDLHKINSKEMQEGGHTY
jgi:cytochrome d ubiquinol oxidase subunit II